MSFYLSILIHWLHVGAAFLWVSTVILVLLMLPGILQQPAAQGREFYIRLNQRIKPLAIAAGQTTLICGILRGTWLGPIQSWHALFATTYGLTFLTAIVLVIMLMVAGGKFFTGLPARVWVNDTLAPDANVYIRRHTLLQAGLLALIIGCMVLMRFGL